MAIAKTALQIIIEEDLTKNASIVGSYMKQKFTDIKSPMIWDTRGRGLLQCIEVTNDQKVNAHDLQEIMLGYGLLTKPSNDWSIPFTPPLVMTQNEVDEVTEILEQSLHDLKKLNDSRKEKVI